MAEGSAGGKPGDFFVGLVDFFSILLPGVMLAFVLFKWTERWDPTLTALPFPDGLAGLLTAALVSYVLGHLLSVVASLCLDPLYDWWKGSVHVWKRSRLAGLDVLWENLNEWERLHLQAGADLKDAATGLRVWSPGAAAEMDHLEAEQKFFRGLILVFLFAWPTFLWDWNWRSVWPWGGVALLLFPLLPFKIFKGRLSNVWTQRLPAVKLATLALLLMGWVIWFAITPSSPLPSTTDVPKYESPVLLVTATSGALSVTAKSESRQTPDIAWTLVRRHGLAFKALLFLALALSFVRFFQQRLKYTKFVYRAYNALKSRPGDAASGEGPPWEYPAFRV